MRRRRKSTKIYILILILFAVSLGFATLSTTLKINGTSTLNKNTWSIYWDNIANKKGVTPQIEPEIIEDENHNQNTKLTMTVDLSLPGDFYEFTVDAVNAGTIDAKVDVVSKSTIPNAYKDVIEYNVTYENLAPIKEGDRLDAGTKVTYKVSVKYKKDINSNQLINENINLPLTLNITYNQADSYSLKNSNYSVYSWDDSLIQNYFSNDILDILNTYKISRIYQCIRYEDIDRANTPYYNFLKRMNDNGIKVYTMFGDPSFYNHPEYLKKDIQKIVDFNNSVDSEHRITGVVFDIEPYGDPSYNADVETGFRTLVETYEEVAKYAHERGVEVVYSIPYWYESYYDDGYSEEFSNDVRGLLERIIKAADITSVMNYSIDTSTSDMDDEVALAKANNKIIETISEFGSYDGNENLTFWNHEHPIKDAQNLYKTMFNKYKYQNFGFSYHHLGNLLQIDKNYKYYHFHFYDVDNDKVISDDRYDYYEGNEIKFTTAIDWRGNATTLTKSNDFTVRARGYVNSTFTIEKIENQMTYINVNHTGGKITYQIEFYAKYNDNSLPDGGQICVTEVGDIEDKCYNVYGPDTYKLIFINKVYLNTKYNIYLIDSSNNRHELITCEYELGICKNNDSTFSIDTDYNQDHYIGLSLIFDKQVNN